MTYIWLAIVIALGLLEISTVNLVSIWFVISGIAAMIISLFTDNATLEVSVFVILGIALLPISKKIYKNISKTKTRTNLDRIIGMKGIVTENITKDTTGVVKVDGKVWSSYADANLEKGSAVEVLQINGVKIKVKKWEEK